MRSDSPGGSAYSSNPDGWLDEHGDYLFRYAVLRVRSAEVAEDLLQETLLAAFKARATFDGRATERTWLTGILKHKMHDYFRKLGRETSFTDLDFMSGELSRQFRNGFWDHDLGPKDWTPPADRTLENNEFWTVLDACLSKLPDKIGTIFQLREMDGLPGREICEMLQVSESNLWVMLHRARMALRQCLEMNWFHGA